MKNLEGKIAQAGALATELVSVYGIIGPPLVAAVKAFISWLHRNDDKEEGEPVVELSAEELDIIADRIMALDDVRIALSKAEAGQTS